MSDLHNALTGSDLHDPKGLSPTPLATASNTPNAYRIEDASGNALLVMDTSTGAQSISLGNATTNPDITMVGNGSISLGGDLSVVIPDTQGDNIALDIEVQDNDGGGVIQLIALSGEVWTGAPTALQIDYSGATSLSNAGDYLGVDLLGATNGGAGNSKAITIDAGWDAGIECSSSVEVIDSLLTCTVSNSATSNSTMNINADDRDDSSNIVNISLSSQVWTGAPTGLSVDFNSATSITNAGEPVGIEILGQTNAGAGLSIGLDVDNGWDVGFRTASSVLINSELQHSGSTLGFYSTSAITKPTVTGSRGGNAALASLLTELANLGLITDSST